MKHLFVLLLLARKASELRNSPIKFEDHNTVEVFTVFDGKQFLDKEVK